MQSLNYSAPAAIKFNSPSDYNAIARFRKYRRAQIVSNMRGIKNTFTDISHVNIAFLQLIDAPGIWRSAGLVPAPQWSPR